MRVKLSSWPDPKDISSASIGSVYGGLNIRSDPTECTSTQSPDMCNMWYRDGALRKRWGQTEVYDSGNTVEKNCVWYSRLFNGWFVWMMDGIFYYALPDELDKPKKITGEQMGCQHDVGDFVAFDEYLFYKAPGAYFRIKVHDSYKVPVVERIYERYGYINYEPVSSDAAYWYKIGAGDYYVLNPTLVTRPVIAINRNPDGTGGDLYQPENRINPYKEVWFDSDTTSKNYYMPVHGCTIVSVQVEDDVCTEFTQKDGYRSGTVGDYTFKIYYEDISDLSVLYTYIEFSAPLHDAIEVSDDSVDTTTPAELSNKVRVVYLKENDDAFTAIVNSKRSIDYGGSDSICMVTGNTPAQPNAIFWTGNDSAGVNPTYWPMDQYNLVGAYQDPITAFGKYSSYLIILQEHQTSKGSYSIETNSNTSREFIDIAVSTINPERGCDVPRSVQLCGNNLVWADTHHGVCYLSDTSWANENTIYKISQNVDGNKYRPGLIADLTSVFDLNTISSVDDGERYYLWVGDHLWVWDYTISSVSDGISTLSWTKHTGFSVADAVSADTGRVLWLNPYGSICEMKEECNKDFNESFSCWYTSPTQTFGGYYKLRNINKLILSISSEEGGRLRVYYGGERTSNPAKEMDTALKASMQIRIPKREFPNAVVLKPRCLNVHHFYFRIEADGDDGGLSLDNALILYTTMGVSR